MSENTSPSQEETNQPVAEATLSQDDKNMGMFCHLAAFAGLVIPFGMIIGPLVIWLMKKDQSEYIDYHGKESVNFQITMAIAFMISFVLMFVVIGVFLMFGLAIFELIVIIMAAIKANEGERYQYPFNFRFIK
ncbi:MAG: DUF4870 domain-containing protein [Kangiellaceae bacterium]|nr:DUF4870 domain-containing protein [Kangiellaceae bacterium]